MTARRTKAVLEPYVLTLSDVANTYFRRSETWAKISLRKLYPDFPKDRDGLYHRTQVERWVDRRFGIVAESRLAQEEQALEAAKNYGRARAAHSNETAK